jgi:hypothetical protein
LILARIRLRLLQNQEQRQEDIVEVEAHLELDRKLIKARQELEEEELLYKGLRTIKQRSMNSLTQFWTFLLVSTKSIWANSLSYSVK